MLRAFVPAVIVLAVLPGVAPAGIRIPALPRNALDPAAARGPRNPTFDRSLVAVSLEPHAGCLDAAGPLRLTVAVVNLSPGPVAVDWSDVMGHVSLTPVGPGRATPRPAAPPKPGEQVGPRRTATLTVDLKDWFHVTGPSVYRLDYARPLPDGRVHVCDPVYFLVEDFADIDRWARARWPQDPETREGAAALLKANPLFATGVVRPGWTDREGPDRVPVPWAAPLAAARKAWCLDGGVLWETKTVPGLFARSAAVSGGFDVPDTREDGAPGLSLVHALAGRALHPHYTKLAPADQLEVAVGLAAAKDRSLREFAIMALGCWADGPEAARVLVRLADDLDPAVAAHAITYTAKFQKDPLVARLLRRKLAGPDGRVSLAAAIRLCFGGDAAGFPVLLRLTRHTDDLVRIQAIAMLVDRTVYGYDKAKAEAALIERLGAETESRFIQRALESLGSYHSDRVQAAVRPFLTHSDPLVRMRAEFTLKQSAAK